MVTCPEVARGAVVGMGDMMTVTVMVSSYVTLLKCVDMGKERYYGLSSRVATVKQKSVENEIF